MFLKEMKKSGYTILHLILEFSNKEPKDCAKKQSIAIINGWFQSFLNKIRESHFLVRHSIFFNF